MEKLKTGAKAQGTKRQWEQVDMDMDAKRTLYALPAPTITPSYVPPVPVPVAPPVPPRPAPTTYAPPPTSYVPPGPVPVAPVPTPVGPVTALTPHRGVTTPVGPETVTTPVGPVTNPTPVLKSSAFLFPLRRRRQSLAAPTQAAAPSPAPTEPKPPEPKPPAPTQQPPAEQIQPPAASTTPTGEAPSPATPITELALRTRLPPVEVAPEGGSASPVALEEGSASPVAPEGGSASPVAPAGGSASPRDPPAPPEGASTSPVGTVQPDDVCPGCICNPCECQPKEEEITCAFCHEPFKSTAADVMKMPECPHMFHRECVNRYCEVTGKALNKACPYKCTRPADDPYESDEGGVSVVGTLVTPSGVQVGGSSSSGSGSVTIL